MSTTCNVLFLCTGNSARSVMAECILNRTGAGAFKAYSAGSHPTGAINPRARALLARLGHDVGGLRSKSWDEFARPGAPEMAFVFTVCDNAAGEVCPVWPGRPASAHWGFADPAAFQGPDAEADAHFAEIYGRIERRIEAFVKLPFRALDQPALEARLDRIGRES